MIFLWVSYLLLVDHGVGVTMSSVAPTQIAETTGLPPPPALMTRPAATTDSTLTSGPEPAPSSPGLAVPGTPPPPHPHSSAPGAEHPQGWEDFYRLHVGPLYRYVYARTGNQADAEDLTSQVFLQAFPRLAWRPTPEMRSYLFATARTVLADHWRQHYGAEVDELPFDTADPGGGLDDDGGGVSALRAAQLLSRLPDRYHRVLELRFLQGCSVRETARIMGISLANAKVIQLRALRLAARLGT
jgi:RNA polymerase sigma factor (sigma-70 family)